MTILEEARRDMKEWPQLRLGQAVFNIAHGRCPQVRHLTGTALDPFYHDDRIDAFLARIKELFGVQ
jgi:hypothetical protein